MKKILMLAVAVILLASISFALDVRILGHDYWVSIGGQMRLIKVHWEKDEQHLLFFKDDVGNPMFLGEEIFLGDLKIHDSYIENNGEWTAGYHKRFR